MSAVVGALCLSACQVRLDLGVIGRANGHLDVLVTVQADDDVRSALMRAGRLEGLASRSVAARLPAWDVAAEDEATLALIARDVAAQDAGAVIGDLVEALGLGNDVLSLDVTTPGGDAGRGLDAVVEVGVPDLAAFDGGTILIDEDRWVEAMAAAADATTASVWIALAGDVDLDASNAASDVAASPRGRGLVWPLTLGQEAAVAARPAEPAGPAPWLFAVGGFAAGAPIGMLGARRRRRDHASRVPQA